MQGKIAEVFKSIQGEGPYLGKEQIFIRFYGCNLKDCKFCDTELSSFKEYQPRDLLDYLKSYSDCRFVSLTGGEPLVQVDFLQELLILIKKAGYRVYLETNATLPRALGQVIDNLDIIAMDFKLPSSTGLRDFWEEHEEFINIAQEREVFVKAVICNSTTLTDIIKATELLAHFNKNIPFILQPDTSRLNRELMQKAQKFRIYCSEILSDVRLIPQMHRLAGIK
ncbi:MAG: 7-carboxy-7-deazaguanine synthase QueE [Candidatus Omnitrophota bacterium]